jgi:hypothetical protein
MKCHNSRADEHLEVKELRISYEEDAMSVILEIKSQNTLCDSCEKIRFRKINNMMK